MTEPTIQDRMNESQWDIPKVVKKGKPMASDKKDKSF